MKKAGKEAGYSLIELIATLSFSSILMGMTAMNIKDIEDPVSNSAALVAGFLKQARARAISTTAAYLVEPVSATEVRASFATNCNETEFTPDNKFILNLPTGAYLSDLNWSICFTPRGLSDVSDVVGIQNNEGGMESVEVFLGGAIRVSPSDTES